MLGMLGLPQLQVIDWMTPLLGTQPVLMGRLLGNARWATVESVGPHASSKDRERIGSSKYRSE